MQGAILLPTAAAETRAIRAEASNARIRPCEWVVLVFLAYTIALALIFPLAPAVKNRLTLVNCAVVLAYGALIHSDCRKCTPAIALARDWLPLSLTLLAYREMGWFALAHSGHSMESRLVVLDRLFLHGGGKVIIEGLGPVLPAILETAYALVYALAPASLALLYLYGCRRRADRFLFVFVLGVLLCYCQFPFWPSDPPRTVFFGDDFPSYNSVIRRFNWWMLGNYGIHTSVFPSAHVAGAFSAAFGMQLALPERRWVSRFLFATAVLIAIATVYGRYHYLADGLAGLTMAIFARAAANLADRHAGRKSMPPHIAAGVAEHAGD